MKLAVHLAQCVKLAPQGMLAAIYHSSKILKVSSNSLCHVVPLLAKSCRPAASCIFKACFNCKEQNLVTEENIPFLLSTLRLGNKSNYGVGFQCPRVQPNRGSHQREETRRK